MPELWQMANGFVMLPSLALVMALNSGNLFFGLSN